MTTIEQAKAFATRAHAGQTRKGAGAEPYVIHLEEVADLVARHGGSEAAIIAAWLHDTVEDCDTTAADIETHFGPKIAAIVAQLTDDKSLEKAERKRMQIVNAAGKLPEAALVKICDKLSNIRAVGETPPLHWPQARQLAYLDWAETVVAALPAGADPARAAFARQLAASRAQARARA
ncbi:bifunctional (p)ppGpp synthetase/guanosine-3',5'-bis(diphosphate) 3'-pyrophosphohydrolase [Pseudorhodobacter sp. E13]|uniref:HD domain-containing protein n=1 Tax=Pseudorhodobacter sp. E13 TaxID=2487931 RepID=UPI000F8D5313|nr:HD domain-containing protein [Pseudorhodobacter sp. E13]RUS60467.1 bifunctional (p)ppGpp synthetase/guanosine-3',5'-bis(diphosphate) 3'-pyrophosphohydrolase [Pseudorhodobacter sp. E13]